MLSKCARRIFIKFYPLLLCYQNVLYVPLRSKLNFFNFDQHLHFWQEDFVQHSP